MKSLHRDIQHLQVVRVESKHIVRVILASYDMQITQEDLVELHEQFWNEAKALKIPDLENAVNAAERECEIAAFKYHTYRVVLSEKKANRIYDA